MLDELTRELDPDLILQQALRAITRVGRWQSIGISLLAPDGLHWQTRVEDRMAPGEVGALHPLGVGVIGRAYRTGELQHVPDASADADFFLGEDVEAVGSELVVPISFDGQMIGAINLEADRPHAFGPDDLDFAQGIARILAIALKNAQRFDALRRENAERSRAEQALRDVLVNFEGAEAQAGLGSWSFDLRVGQGWWSRQMYTLLRRNPADGMPDTPAYLQLIHPEDRELIAMTMAQMAAGTPPEQRSFRTNPELGPVRTLSPSYRIERDAEGAPVAFFGTVLDISERMYAEEEMRWARDLFTRLFHSSPIATIFTSLPDNLMVDVNEAALALGGYSRHDLIGCSSSELMAFAEPATMGQIQLLLEHQGRVNSLECRIRTRSGELRDCVLYIEPMTIHGHLYTLTQVVDVTEQKSIEAALRASEMQLLELNLTLEERVRERTAEVQDLYEHAPAGYHSLDGEGRILRINQTELAWLGYAREELVGRPFLDLLTAPSRAVFIANFPTFLEQGWVRDLELELIRKDGSRFPVLVSATAMCDAAGNFVMSRSTLLDITARKEAENALRLANAELERALRTKDEFMANMSHELRTPLNAILALSELLQDGVRGPVNERQREALGNIEASGQHLLALINDVLDLSKVEAGHLDLELASVSVAEVSRASMQFVKELAIKKQLKLALSLNDELAVCEADPRRLKQMLVNLLSNAVKFTPSGGSVGLEVAVDPVEGQVSFCVRDTGIGIAPEELPRLFQPFTQLDARLSRHHEGTGLGLVLVRRLAELHGGTVAVTSEVGKGSAFTVTMPCRRARAAELVEPEGRQVAPRTLRSALVVDDSASAVEQLTRYLHELRVATVTQAEAYEALSLARELQPDLIVLDLLLPGRSGWEILAQLKGDLRTRDLPVLIVTVVDERPQGLEAGAAGYLVKPITQDALRQALAAMGYVMPAPAAGHALPVPPPRRAPAPGLRVLLAEDNEINMQVARDYLEMKGFAVVVARDGRAALAMAAAERPDIILMDIQMPEVDGLEAIRRLRATAACASTPIIALTALAMPGDRERCLAAGANAYMTKPVRLTELVELIGRLTAPA